MAARQDISRRDLLRGSPRPLPVRPRPPGVSRNTLSACTRCKACVEVCPTHVVVLSADGVALDASAGECTFCGKCAEVCPEPVFGDQRTMSHVMEISAGCLVQAGITCMSCRDACPEEAIAMLPRIGAPFLPSLNADLCTGCSACASVCPAEAIHAAEKEPEDA